MREPLPTRVEDTPPLPPEYDRALDDGLRSLGLELDATVGKAQDGHVRLLLAWTLAINLTAIDDPTRAATAHVVDSLTAVTPLRSRGIDQFLDLGSGGGFPGLPLAAVLPAEHALLVDSVAKKTRFLATAVQALELDRRVAVFTGRAEALAADPGHRERWPAVTVRAVGALADLVEMAFPLLAPGGLLVAWKRGSLESEVDAGRRAVHGLGGGTIESIEIGEPLLGHRLVLITKRGRTQPSFPRDPAQRRRVPW